MRYETQIKKLLQILEAENSNTINSNGLLKISYLARPENFIKALGVITLTVGFNPQSGTTKPTSEGGYINPLVTVVQGIPQISPPPPIFPVILNLALAGGPVTIPNVVQNGDNTFLFVVDSDNYLPVPDTEEDVATIGGNITPTGGQPTPIDTNDLQYYGQGVFAYTPPADSTGTNFSLTLESPDGSLNQTVNVTTTPATTVATQPPGSTQLTPNIGSPAGNPFTNTNAPVITQPSGTAQVINLPAPVINLSGLGQGTLGNMTMGLQPSLAF